MSDTTAFYGRWATLYDRLSTISFVRSWRRRAVESLTLSPGDTVVEMGCGTGANVPELRKQVHPGGRVVGLDLTPAMLAKATDNAGRTGEAVQYLRGDAARPPVRSVDAVLATFVAGLFDDPAAAVDAWCDCVAPGGRVALLNFQRSQSALSTPLHVAFEGFVRLSSPGERFSGQSHADAFEQRVRVARDRLTERTIARHYETFGGGYLGLVAGTVTGEGG